MKSERNDEILKKDLPNAIEEKYQKKECFVKNMSERSIRFSYTKESGLIVETVSKGLANLFGYGNENLLLKLNKNIMFNVYEDDILELKKNILNAIESCCHLDISFRMYVSGQKDPIFIRFEGDFFRENGKTYCNGTANPVHECDERIIQKREMFASILNKVPTGIGVYEINKGVPSVSFVNDAVFTMLGYTSEKRNIFYEVDFFDLFHPEDVQHIKKIIQSFMDGSKSGIILYRMKNIDNEWMWIKWTGMEIGRCNERIVIYASLFDCDELVKVQDDLKESKIMMDAALRNAEIFSWRYNYKTDVVTDSGTLGEALNLPKVVKDPLHNKTIRAIIERDFFKNFETIHENIRKELPCTAELMLSLLDEEGYSWVKLIYTPTFSITGEYIDSIGIAIDITEQKEKELTYKNLLDLRKSGGNDSIASVTFNVSKNIVTDADNKTPEYKALLALDSPNDILKNILSEVTDEKERALFDNVCNCLAIRRSFKRGVSHVEVRHHLKGKPGSFLMTFDTLKNPYTRDIETFVELHDITSAIQSELIVKKIASISYEIVFAINVKTRKSICYRNQNKYNVLGTLMDPLFEKDMDFEDAQKFLLEYVHEKERENVKNESNIDFVIQKLETQSVYEKKVSITIKGSIYYKHMYFTYLEDSHETILCAIKDVTKSVEHTEQQRKELAVAFETAKKANQSKTEFYLKISHDMRTPLNGILGLAELSEKENDIADLKENISQIKKSGFFLLSLIDDILEFQKMENGTLQLYKQVVYAENWFKPIENMFHRMADEKGVNFKFKNINADMDWYVKLDPLRMQQIFIKIVSNAIKFTPTGGTVIMEVENLSREGMISHNCIRFIDNGIGMSEDFVKNHLFKNFEQEDNGVISPYAGTGIGLSVVKHLVDSMHGRIEVESHKGRGSVFTLYIDFERVDEKEAEKFLGRKNHYLDKKILKDKKILIVEDLQLNAKITMKLLEGVGCLSEVAENGKIGVDKIAAVNGKFDAVLMDIRMPVMDGLEAAKAIRKLGTPYAQKIPIIAMSANAYTEDVKKSLEAGMNAHLSKPIDSEKFFETLIKFCKIKK